MAPVSMFTLPNLLTLTNLLFGCLALLNILYFDVPTAALFILGSFVCDYADGMAARALKITSPLGRELDSLADIVSFGVVPGALFYHMLAQGWCGGIALSLKGVEWICYGALPAFILTAFSALRLAKFNIDTRQTGYFLGLTTPATTLFVLGLSLAAEYNEYGLRDLLHSPYLIYGLIVALCALLISEIPMFGLKMKPGGVQKNAFTIAFAVSGLLVMYFLRWSGLSVMVLVYIALSVIQKRKVLELAG